MAQEDLRIDEWVAPGSMSGGTHYVIRGEGNAGEWVVLTHGIGSFHECFNRLAICLASKGFRVVQYDLIGRGFSSPSPSGQYGADDHLMQLHQLVTDLQLPPFHLVGHSMGGALVTLFAGSYPERVNSLTVLCPAGLMNSLPLALIKTRCLHGLVRSILADEKGQEKVWRESFYVHDETTKALEDEMVHNMHIMYRHNLEATNALFRSVMDFPLYGLVDKVVSTSKHGIPAMVMWGERDQVVPFSTNHHRWVHALREGGGRVVDRQYRDVAHGLLLEIHDLVARDIVEFLESTVERR